MELNEKRYKTAIIIGIVLLVGLCLLTAFTVLGSSLGLWFVFGTSAESSRPTPRITRHISTAPTFTPTATPTILPTPTPTLTVTPTPLPTATPSPTPVPPTPTPLPPTDTPLPAAAPPTATPPPTDTPVPSYPFEIVETGQFPTNHESFDIYIAVTDEDNKPLSGYRVLGTHSSGDQQESQTSAGDWIANSGAMHYKAGNIKYEVPKSPGGVWTLQLVDQAGTPVAPPVEFPYDPGSPTWYFLLYRLAG